MPSCSDGRDQRLPACFCLCSLTFRPSTAHDLLAQELAEHSAIAFVADVQALAADLNSSRRCDLAPCVCGQVGAARLAGASGRSRRAFALPYFTCCFPAPQALPLGAADVPFVVGRDLQQRWQAAHVHARTRPIYKGLCIGRPSKDV